MSKIRPIQIFMSIALIVFVTYNVIDWYQWKSLMSEFGKLPLGLWSYLFNIL